MRLANTSHILTLFSIIMRKTPFFFLKEQKNKYLKMFNSIHFLISIVSKNFCQIKHINILYNIICCISHLIICFIPLNVSEIRSFLCLKSLRVNGYRDVGGLTPV